MTWTCSHQIQPCMKKTIRILNCAFVFSATWLLKYQVWQELISGQTNSKSLCLSPSFILSFSLRVADISAYRGLRRCWAWHHKTGWRGERERQRARVCEQINTLCVGGFQLLWLTHTQCLIEKPSRSIRTESKCTVSCRFMSTVFSLILKLYQLLEIVLENVTIFVCLCVWVCMRMWQLFISLSEACLNR